MATLNDVVVNITANPSSFTSKVDSAFKSAGAKIKGWAADMKAKLSNMTGGMLEGLVTGLSVAAVGKAIYDVVKAANEMNTALSRLEILVHNVNPAVHVTKSELAGMANELAKNSQFIDDDIVPALFKAVNVTKDYATGVAVVKDAMALATVTGMDLTTATNLVAQAHEGFTMGLSRAGKQVGLNIKEGASYAEIIGEIRKQAEGLGDVMEQDLGVALRKLGDESSGYFEEIITPNLTYLQSTIKFIGESVKFIVAAFLVVGDSFSAMFYGFTDGIKLMAEYLVGVVKAIKDGMWNDDLGSIGKNISLVVGEIERKAKAVNDRIIEQADATYRKIQAMYGAGAGVTMPGPGLPPKPQQDKEDKEDAEKLKAIAEFEKKKAKIRLDWDIWLAKELEKNDTDTWAEVDANMEAALKRQVEMYSNYMNMINYALQNSLMSGIDSLALALSGQAVNWKEWANSIIKELERVIAKMLIMKALEVLLNMISPGAGTGLMSWMGYATSAPGVNNMINRASGRSSGAGGQQTVVQIMPLDAADSNGLQMALVRRVNTAYASATPRDRALLARNVTAGQIADVGR